MLLYSWITTANGYLRLATFKFPQAHRTSMPFDAEKINRLERIVNFVANVYVPMFLKVHLKPRASEGPENALLLRDLLLFFNQQDQTLVCKAIKKCFLKHAASWLNPTNVAVSVFCDNPPFHFLLFTREAIFALTSPHSQNIMDIVATYDNSFPGKANVHLASSFVMRDSRGPWTITIVFANVSLVSCQLSWRVTKCATGLVP